MYIYSKEDAIMAKKYSAKKRRVQRNRRIAAVFAILIAVALTVLIVNLISNRQTLEGAELSETLSIENNIPSVTHTETQRFYEINIFRPDFDAKKLPAEMNTFITDAEAQFRTQLDSLLAEKKLSKKDKAKLNISYVADNFQHFTTYTVTADIYVSKDNPANANLSSRYAIDDNTGSQYTADSIFNEDYNYKAVLASKIAAQLGDISLTSEITALDKPFDRNLFMTSEGLRIEFGQDVGEAISAGDVFTVEYKYIYYGLSFELPDKYKPPEPNPIDPKKEKVVALTFDDGPSGNVTPKLLDLLDQYDAKATFFVVGEMADTYPEIVKDILDRGHTLGLHTVNHTHLTKVCVEKAISAVEDEASLLEEITGKSVYYLRPPGGFINKSLAQTIGRPCIMWDVDPLDWKYRDAQKVSDAVLNSVSSGDIVLSHDLYKSTYEAYAIIIPELAKRGYRFVSLDELLGTTDPSIEGAYAGEIIYYRDLAIDLRNDGKFGK